MTARRLALCCAAAVVLAGGWLAWKDDRQDHQKTQAQILRYDPQADSALATTGERGSLFTFSFPPDTAEEAREPGAVVTLTGPDYWLESYPRQYPGVVRVRWKEEGEDLAGRYLEQLVSQCAGGSPQEVEQAVSRLPGLNDGQREGLEYLALCELGLF